MQGSIIGVQYLQEQVMSTVKINSSIGSGQTRGGVIRTNALAQLIQHLHDRHQQTARYSIAKGVSTGQWVEVTPRVDRTG